MTFIFHTVTYVTYMSRGAKVSCHYYKSNYPKFIGCKMHQCKTSNSLCVHHWLLVCFQSPRYKGNLIEIDKYFSCSHTDKIIFIFFISLATWPGVTTEVAGGQWPWFTAECYRAAAGWPGLAGSPGQPACWPRGEYTLSYYELGHHCKPSSDWCSTQWSPDIFQTAIIFIEIFWRMSNVK